MSKMASGCSLQFSLLLFFSPLFHLIPVLADHLPSLSSKTETKGSSHGSSRNSVALTIVLICLGVLAVVGFSVFLFKIWQKKRREDQQARLLKLFDEDDELEVELGIRE